jgi:heptosyltransferase II
MVCTTPMFRAIKEQYPACQVWVMGNAINKELLAGHPDVDNYIIYEHRKDIGQLVNEARSWQIDAACITAPEARPLTFLYLASIPLIVAPRIKNGRSPYETPLYKILSRLAVTAPHHMGSYAPREYLRLLEPLGIKTGNTAKRVTYSPTAQKKVREFFAKDGLRPEKDFLVGISPGAGNKIKTWPAERFARVAEYIQKNYGAKIIVLGGARDAEETAGMFAALSPASPVTNAVGAFSIDELKAAVAKLNLFIAVDTGPIYIAEAFGVPTIDIVGPIDEREQPPISEKHRVVVAPRQAPALYVMNARVYDAAEARRQTEEITVEMVTAEFDRLAAALGRKKTI